MIVFWVLFAFIMVCLIMPAFVIGFIKYITWLGRVTGITNDE